MPNDSRSLNKINIPELSLPKGGGAIKGIGETFQPNSFSGVGSFSVPIYTSPCRGFEPKISLDYHSGSGNGVFGTGFSLSVPKISRKTEQGIPKYRDTDIFIISNAEDLVPDETKQITQDGIVWEVTSYRPRIEGLFARIEYWKNTAESYWKTVSKENLTTLYGRNGNSRIADPADQTRVFEWLIEETYDAKGNKIQYTYQPENSVNVKDAIYEQNRSITANRYLQSIRYGNYFGKNAQEAWAFEIIFDYGEYDLSPDYLAQSDCNPYQPTGTWLARPDPFSSYRSGFEIRTYRLCRNIMLFHHLEDELGANPCLVRTTGLNYQESPVMSQITRIAAGGYRRNNDGSYQSQAMPPVDLTFSAFHPVDQEFQTLQVNADSSIPGYFQKSQYQWIDLYGEGMPGLLFSNDQVTLYWKPAGNGVYGYPEPPVQFPIDHDLQKAEYSLTSLEGNGRLDLVVGTPQRGGFYLSNPDGAWEIYRGFESYPLEYLNPHKEMLDTSGDGIPDLVVPEENQLKIYPSLKSKGYGGPVQVYLNAGPDGQKFPTTGSHDAEEVISYADLCGDGLSHRVRIRNGSVEYWPNLGYGRFGNRILMGNAPSFDNQFDPSRLFFADLDGSGDTDLIYLHPDRIDLYLNQSGNSFSSPVSIPLPEIFSLNDQISFADVVGNGSSCLIFTKAAPAIIHYYYDFTGGHKPYLLQLIDNNLGAVTGIEYRSSVSYYFEDLNSGQPWKTKLPFPVQVVSKTESIDQITGSKLVTCYQYHDGFYDYTEREFRGFGFVEEWDTQSYDEYAKPGILNNTNYRRTEPEEHIPPVYIKRWYHTGAYLESGILSRQYRHDYYQLDNQAYTMPDSTMNQSIIAADAGTIRQAYRALKGKLLREEIYACDGQPGLSENPYTVTESNYHIRELQAPTPFTKGVYYVFEQENLTYHYERNAHDPRIQHQFMLEVDDYGNLIKSCQVFYPRRQPPTGKVLANPGDQIYPEQLQLKVTAELNSFINQTVDFRLLGILSEGKTFEIGGLILSYTYFSLAEIWTQINEALKNQIPYDGTFTPGEKQARLLTWERNYFWNLPQDARLPLGEITGQALLYNSQTAVFTPDQINEVYQGKVTPAMLEEAGYYLEENYYWNRGSVTMYYKDDDQRFFLPYQNANFFAEPDSALYHNTVFGYDPYCLAITTTSQYLTEQIANTTEALIDYYTMQPRQIIDLNANIAQAIYDPLDKVIATSIYGVTDGRREGDIDLQDYQVIPDPTFEDVLANPAKYLQNATSYNFYDQSAWVDRGQPACYITLTRETHVSELPPGETSRIQIQVGYGDGFGRELETKGKADPGPVTARDERGKISRDEAGRIRRTTVQERWLVSGRTVYNNKGKPVRQYLPYFSPIPGYESQVEMDPALPPPTITHYDPLLRVIRIDTPKGFFSKVEFTPWQQSVWDQNDTVKDSPYYINFMDHYPSNPNQAQQDEKDALDKAAQFYNTPAIQVFDNQGHPFLNIQMSDAQKQLPTYSETDIEGRVIRTADPRIYAMNLQDNTGCYNFQYSYDMRGTSLAVDSADAGLRLTMADIFGEPIHAWDNRGFHLQNLYDNFGRLVEVRVNGDDGNGLVLNQSMEKLIYGEYYGQTIEESKDKNLRGQVYQHYDQGGIALFPLYNIQSQVLQTSRQLLPDYKNEVNWNQPNQVVPELEIFHTSYTYDALNRIVTETTPDQSVKTIHYNLAGLIDNVKVAFSDSSEEEFVHGIDYNANLELLEIMYGNGTETVYQYEETTGRVLRIQSGQPGKLSASASGGQDITNTYDPVGNVTRCRDASYETIYHNQQIVEPLNDYTYNAIYQLTEAGGRQHPGVLPNGRPNPKKDPGAFLAKMVHLNDGQQLEKYQESYEYDDSGNFNVLHHQSVSGSWTRRMDVAADCNRMTQVDSAVSGIGTYQTFYDGNGNLLNLENLNRLVWNYRNNIARADIVIRENDLSDREYYVYDSQGRRLRKVNERKVSEGLIEVEEKIYLGSFEIKRITQKTVAEETVILDRQTLHVKDSRKLITVTNYWLKDDYHRETDQVGSRQFRYQFSNYLGSCSLELDGQGNLISYEEYFPYGGTSLLGGENEREVELKEYRYSGKERDVTGLYYYGARYYPPWLGRWLNPDPAGTMNGLNLYGFVGGNPVSSVDLGGYVKTLAQKLAEDYHITTKDQGDQMLVHYGVNRSQPHLDRRYSSIAQVGGLTMEAPWEKLKKGVYSYFPAVQNQMVGSSSKVTPLTSSSTVSSLKDIGIWTQYDKDVIREIYKLSRDRGKHVTDKDKYPLAVFRSGAEFSKRSLDYNLGIVHKPTGGYEFQNARKVVVFHLDYLDIPKILDKTPDIRANPWPGQYPGMQANKTNSTTAKEFRYLMRLPGKVFENVIFAKFNEVSGQDEVVDMTQYNESILEFSKAHLPQEKQWDQKLATKVDHKAWLKKINNFLF